MGLSWKGVGHALQKAKPFVALAVPGWIGSSMDVFESIFTKPGSGKEKAEALDKEVEDNILPKVEALTGKNVNVPAVKAAIAHFRDAKVAAENAFAALEAAKEDLESVIANAIK